MRLDRAMRLRLAAFTAMAILGIAVMFLQVGHVPAWYFGIGRYTVTVELPETGGLYATSEVTYRGVAVGRVKVVKLTVTGVQAELALRSGIDIPSDLTAEVHSQSAIGEQYIELLPRNGSSAPLKDGDVIALKDTNVPPDINTVLDDLVTDLKAVSHHNLKTVIDEASVAVGGLGPQLAKIVDGSTTLAIDARKNLDPLLVLLDRAKPVLDSQNRTSDAIAAWASQVATVTAQLQAHDEAVAGILDNGGPALGEARQLVDRLQPTLPTLLANLASTSQVALTYRNDLEQILVLAPQLIAIEWASILANTDTKQPYRGMYLSFNLNLNLPPPCATGYLPAQQRRVDTFEDYPDRPAGDLYCRVPQDSPFGVRGARNIPCETVPGKRAATVKMCESDEEYVPLNDGFNWKGDPNATFTGQDVPQLRPGSTPPLAIADYDPATGTYTGPDGKAYTQSDLAQTAPRDKTWQSMLLPPES
ncbi:MCE family protein [Mycobacterium sp. SMC-19]|uniref:MCE family protein n=1 Tax=Mycobacterium sp. SMC-19 TaxID=3381630 RepID=UPI003877653D